MAMWCAARNPSADAREAAVAECTGKPIREHASAWSRTCCAAKHAVASTLGSRPLRSASVAELFRQQCLLAEFTTLGSHTCCRLCMRLVACPPIAIAAHRTRHKATTAQTMQGLSLSKNGYGVSSSLHTNAHIYIYTHANIYVYNT